MGDRYVASLPWKGDLSELNDNKQGAFTRLNSLIRKLSKEPGKLLEYDAAIWEFISSGVAERVSDESKGNPVYCMPHRPVYRAEKSTTRVRVVFDASSHESNAKSLNDLLETGVNVLPDLLKMTLNFRCGKIGLVADIEKAFLQVILDERDRDSHRFLWFAEKLEPEGRTRPLQVYRMTRVTFGVTCSPSLLGACLLKHLQSESVKYPETCSVLQQSFYMDDLVLSTHDREAAERLHREATTVMKSISMNLRKWNTNDVELRRLFSTTDQLPNMQKVLGVCWFVNLDELGVDLEPVQQLLESPEFLGTKRQILQVISRIFNPLGILTPCTIRMKILFQSAWRLKLDWDERPPDELLHSWSAYRTDLAELKEIAIPRSVITKSNLQLQLHIFADASLHAYGAVAYVRTTDIAGNVQSRFLCSKNRVTPLKENGSREVTLPKLELTAAVIAARLLKYFRSNLKFAIDDVWLWTDSKITLYWIRGDKGKWKPYVANRVKEIREISEISRWRHCPGIDNPADLLTRGITAKTLLSSSLWLEGPNWLTDYPERWPPNDFDPEVITPCLLMAGQDDNSGGLEPMHVSEPPLSPDKFSELRRLLRVTAWVFRFIDLSRRKLSREEQGHLSAEEMRFAENYWIRNAQLQQFNGEIRALRCGQPIMQTSKVATLNPFLDNEGFLRVGGRLQFMEEGTPHPIILPKSSHITMLVVRDLHKRTLHGGVNLVLTRLRERFWVPQGRQLIKSVIRKCVVCRIQSAKPASQPFAPLPRDRLKISRPFDVVGVDFAGPLYAKVVPNGDSKKFYIMLFTCAAVRAVHLELTPDLSTESCLLGLRRFIARRGTPSIIYSDNARTFRRASMELRKLENFIRNRKLQDFSSDQHISWKFIVERAPWWRGFWERLIRIIKGSLRATIGRATLNQGDDPLELEPLTPAHFLQGSPPLTLPSVVCDTKEPDDLRLRQLWKDRIRALMSFKKRWRNEYLQQLRSLHHERKNFSSDVSPGDVVLLHDPASPRVFWKLALVESVYPGRDGKIRSCLVRLHNGVKLRRPVQLLYPLELRSPARPVDVEKTA